MRYFHKTQNKFFCPTINVEKLWTLVSVEVRAQQPDSRTRLALALCRYRPLAAASAGGLLAGLPPLTAGSSGREWVGAESPSSLVLERCQCSRRDAMRARRH